MLPSRRGSLQAQEGAAAQSGVWELVREGRRRRRKVVKIFILEKEG